MPEACASPALDRSSLEPYFLQGAKTPDDLQIGVEWEKIGVRRADGTSIPYSGPAGVEEIFRRLVARHAWIPVFSGPHIIALGKEGHSITLEPGGQIELSGKKSPSLDGNACELHRHLAEIRGVSEELGIAWLGTGCAPVTDPADIEWVPKERYAIMREALRGPLAHHMMKKTASIQVSVDYTDERDAARKLRLAMALGPVLTGLFANSPFSGGRLNGFESERAHIWTGTAPERTGLIPRVFESDFGFRDYVEYALGVPVLFIVRGERWTSLEGMPFGTFLDRGFRGERATLADWELHLTTIFTDARLKHYIEIRGIDCQRTETGLSAPAFIKGIFYDAKALSEAWDLLAGIAVEERLRASAEACRRGLSATLGGKPLLETARRLVRIAEQGLIRMAASNPALKNDPLYLQPLLRIAEEGRSPAGALIDDLSRLEPAERIHAFIRKTCIA
ncbi:MAG TPA: glutamate-cysteine ligase family protein [Candidatus Eisenbacteria bacterium]|nr:glutamate-cysteine ligase family protein [Candidatus Eisenbacteria bacterium]